MSDEESSPTANSSNICSRYIRVKSTIPDIANLTGKITRVKLGGWYLTNNPKITRPVRPSEFEFINESDVDDGDDDEGKKGDEEDGSDGSDDDDDTEPKADAKDTPKHSKESKSKASIKTPTTTNNNNDEDEAYKKDFLTLDTRIKIISGPFKGRICIISECRVGIFLKVVVEDGIRVIQPREIEVIEFAPATTPTTKVKKGGYNFGHEKYIGAKVLLDKGKPKKSRKEAVVKSAFSGEWYLVSDDDISVALDRAQIEVVGEGGRKRRRDDSDEDEEEGEEEVDDEEEEEDEDFLSSMKFCGEAVPSTPKSLRKREKRVNYAEKDESSDDVESWHDSDEEDKDEEEVNSELDEEEEEEDSSVESMSEEVEMCIPCNDDDDDNDNSDAEEEKKPAPTKSAVDLTETSETNNEEKGEDAISDEDVKMTAADSSDEDSDDKMDGELAIAAPVVLHSKKSKNNKVELLLSGMSHLPPDTAIDIFNRKTGRVMRGDEAILLKNLPTALLNHAEYEPIIPTPKAATKREAGENKADENMAVESTTDPSFDPYDTSILVGVTAVVKAGPYRGIEAKIKEVQERGRWVLDNDAVKTTVRSSDCHFVDDGKVDKNAIAAHYGTKKKTPMPSFVKPGTVKKGSRKVAVTSRVQRVGRSGTNIRVSNVVIPQSRPHTRVRISAVEGKRVLVTGGEHRGHYGTIASCIPGGWYLVSNMYDADEDALDVLIHSKNLELTNDGSPAKAAVRGDNHEQIKASVHSKASKLLTEKRLKGNKDLAGLL